MSKDKLFARKRRLIKDFDFGKQTTVVFDDMLERSVPFYAEVQRMMGELAAEFAVDGTNLYDLGCSTGTTFLMLDQIRAGVQFVGVDASRDMLEYARRKLRKAGLRHPVELVEGDLNRGVEIVNASVVTMNLTLQFVRPLHRAQLIQTIAKGLIPHGCLLLVEKVLSNDAVLNRHFIKYYYEFKRRQGYTKTEIAQKREALENVLIPYRLDENIQLLTSHGFREVEIFFKWYNFCGLLAIK